MLSHRELVDLLYVLSAPDWTRLWAVENGKYIAMIGAIIVLTGVDARFAQATKDEERIQRMTDGKVIPRLIISGETTTNEAALARGFTPASRLASMVPEACNRLGIEVPETHADVLASNTHESAQNILPVLIEHKVEYALLVMSQPHMLRALLTLRKWFDNHGGGHIMLFTSLTGIDLTNPNAAQDMTDEVIAEAQKLEVYSRWNHCYRRIRKATKANPQAWPSH
jgi:uncharacterized SAM-binding protein YcdF (DUF218 family)